MCPEPANCLLSCEWCVWVRPCVTWQIKGQKVLRGSKWSNLTNNISINAALIQWNQPGFRVYTLMLSPISSASLWHHKLSRSDSREWTCGTAHNQCKVLWTIIDTSLNTGQPTDPSETWQRPKESLIPLLIYLQMWLQWDDVIRKLQIKPQTDANMEYAFMFQSPRQSTHVQGFSLFHFFSGAEAWGTFKSHP